MSFKRIKSRINCKSSDFYFAFFKETRKSQEDLKKRSISLAASEDYVDMSLKKVSCDKSLAAVLLLAKAESVEEESHYEPIYISADFNLATATSPQPDQSDIYEYCDF